MTRMKWMVPAIVGLGLVVIGLPSPTAEAAAQALPKLTVTDDGPARDAATFRKDVAMTNQCIEAGRDKTECLCVTKIMKYELTLAEYRAASQIMSVPASYSQTSSNRSVAKLILSSQGYSEQELNTLSGMSRTLSSAPDFDARCREASNYFSQFVSK